MNKSIKINKDIYWVGVNDRETEIFESLWPLPEGVSYNSYLLIDKKTALIDTVKIDYHDKYLENLDELLGDRDLDYLIINHMEPDHSGSIKAIKRAYPDVQIIGNKKTVNFIEGFYDIDQGFKVIEDGDELNLGIHSLKFFLTPMIHWPETMMTYDQTDNALFAGDAFGSFGALDGGIFDDEINIKSYDSEIRRYYSNIVGKYSPMVQKALKRLSDLDIDIIASTHGPVWREKPEYIIDKYDKLSSQETKQGAVVVYGSMYGNTKMIADRIARSLAENGLKEIKVHDAARTDKSYMISDIWKYEGLIIGSCAYNTKIFPPVGSLIDALLNRRIKNHLLGIFGSYSWSGGGVKRLKQFRENCGMELVEPIIKSKFAPKDETFNYCNQLGKNMAQKIMNKENNE